MSTRRDFLKWTGAVATATCRARLLRTGERLAGANLFARACG